MKLDPITRVPVTSYVVYLALADSPDNYVREMEIPHSDEPYVDFDELTSGATYRVQAISKIDDLKSVKGLIGDVTLCKLSCF